MRAHNRHVLMCTGPLCTKDGVESQAMFEKLGQQIDAHPDLRVKRTRTHCMVACKLKGPVLVVYPEGIWYRCVDDTAVKRIVSEHLEGGREVTEYIIHRLGTGDVCTENCPAEHQHV